MKYLHRMAVGDHVYDSLRDMMGKNPYGRIEYIDREEGEVGVKFFGNPKFMYSYNAKLLAPQWFEGGGEEQDYLIDEMEGTWSSHVGGDGEWKM